MEISLSSLNLHFNSYATISPPTHFHRSLSIKLRPTISLNRSNSHIAIPRTKTQAPARDLMIDFGRYKGKMLGTLPSTYLKWVSTNLRARDSEHWAKLADMVLADPVYRDRIEWEFAQNLLNGNNNYNAVSSLSDSGKVSDLLAEVSERFGWDNDDKLSWSKIDFALLGTSKGGRIPRIETRSRVSVPPEKAAGISREDVRNKGVDSSSRRSERRERLRAKRDSGETSTGLGLEGLDDDDHVMMDNHPIRTCSISTSPFPGRESLSILNKRRSSTRPMKEKDNPQI